MMAGHIDIDRPVYNNLTLDDAFDKVATDRLTRRERAAQCVESVKKRCCSWSAGCLADAILGRVPFIKTLRRYKPRQQLLKDSIAGLCVGIIHIAQGMGFAIMAGVPPIYGLYASFWPVIIYVFFGTGHHVAMGSMALISLMIRTVVDREVAALGLAADPADGNASLVPLVNRSSVQGPSIINYLTGGAQQQNDSAFSIVGGNNGTDEFDLDGFKVSVVMSLSLLVGMIQFLMGVLRLGVVTTFMPAPFVGGLTTGAAFHIATSQMKFVLGLTLPARDGYFKLPVVWYDIAVRIPRIHVASLIIAALCMTIILVIKIQVNQRFKDKLPAPIPPELIVVVLACLVSYVANLEGHFGVKIVKHVPAGMEPPKVPSVEKWFSDYLMDAIMISLMSFSITFSMGSLFGAKHDYAVDANQELLAIGAGHGIGAFFGSFAGTAAPPRCFILDMSGATTQVSGLVTSVFMLFVIFLMGPLFSPMPYSVLGAIIIVAILPLFVQFENLPNLWRVNKYDFAIWVFTFIVVTFVDLNLGLILGIAFSIVTIVMQVYRSKGVTVTMLGDTELFAPTDAYHNTKHLKAVEVFRFQGNLNFVSKDQFKSQISKLVMGIPTADSDASESTSEKPADDNANEMGKLAENGAVEKLLPSKKAPSHYLVLDLSHVSYIDLMGVTTLKKVHTDLRKINIEAVLACVCPNALKTIAKTGGKWNNGDQIIVYPSLIDAVTTCRQQIQA